jgi:hypothetical protein
VTKPVKQGGVNPKLKSAIDKLLAKVMAEPKDGETPFTLTDQMKVIDRALKLDAIRLKVADSGEGEFFKNPPQGADGDE